MYQAIVFLPLLGAILAGVIALMGARSRCPGAEPSDDRSHAHGAAQIHTAHAADHDDHGHGPTEPPAEGSRAAEVITTAFLFIAMVLSWIAFARVGFGHIDERVALFPWMVSGDFKVDWALRIDTLTAVMLVVVTTVSALVHLYSIGYMPRIRIGRASSATCRSSPLRCSRW
jgi:NADH-quinone oxidoreductase subunit L